MPHTRLKEFLRLSAKRLLDEGLDAGLLGTDSPAGELRGGTGLTSCGGHSSCKKLFAIVPPAGHSAHPADVEGAVRRCTIAVRPRSAPLRSAITVSAPLQLRFRLRAYVLFRKRHLLR